jgi:ParB-like chromosome segregation protein Spo0J
MIENIPINEKRGFHPVANIFPMMDFDVLGELTEDIRNNGLLEPIWLDRNGLIIDGRNRYLACKEAGIEPEYRTYEGEGSLVAFVVSLNLKRRHLDSGQKAFVAVDIEKFLAEEAKEQQREAGKLYGENHPKIEDPKESFLSEMENEEPEELNQNFDEPLLPPQKPIERQASQQAAKIVGTNRQYVADAKFIQAKAPDVAEAVKSGIIKIYEAKKVASLPESQRKSVIEKVKSGEKTSKAIYHSKRADKVDNTDWSESELERKDMVERGITVVAHINNDVHLVAWAESNNKYVRIDRFSDWGNPFLFPQDGDRITVIDHYEQYLEWHPSLLKRLGELKGKVLGCWCYPEECHGDVLVEKLNTR